MPVRGVYSDDDLRSQLRRVADLVPEGPMTKALFNELADCNATTPMRRFGDWQQALNAAGLSHRYAGRAVSAKMRTIPSRHMTDAQILAELRRVHSLGDGRPIRISDVAQHSPLISNKVLRLRFGSWPNAVRQAGLRYAGPSSIWTHEQLMANLKDVRDQLGRDPYAREMRPPLSPITESVYRYRYGSLRRALGVLEKAEAPNAASC